jgi:rhomboid protease GluP
LFFLTYIFGSGSEDTLTLYNFGAVYAPSVKSGEVYRLLLGTFLHAGIIHLICNMYSLFVIGTQVENFVGKRKFLGIYLISAISGSLLSCVFSDYLSVGASGAIFGLLGSLLYFGYHYRLYLGSVVRSQIIPIIVLNLFLGFMLNGIDNAAHIGGLIGGFLATMALGINGKSTKGERINAAIVLIIYFAFLAILLFR